MLNEFLSYGQPRTGTDPIISLPVARIHASDDDRFLPEFRLSAIPDRLTLANVRWVEGDAAIEVLTEESISQVQKVTSYASEPAKRILDRYKFAAAGGWVSYGQTLDGSPGTVAYFKPLTPKQYEEASKGFGKVAKIKIAKYVTPEKSPAAPLLPYVDKQTAQSIYDKYHCTPEPGETFWQVVRRYNTPIAITEGLKKALALIAQGIPAIAIRGITLWRIKGTDELHPSIADFATKGRDVFIVLDQDEKETTQKDVRTQILKLGAALASAGSKARVALWNQEAGKGIDDAVYALKDGASGWLESVFGDAPTIKEFKRDAQILKARATIAHLNTLTYPVERATTGEYLPTLPEVSKGAIHVLDAGMGAGKTTRMGSDWVQAWPSGGGLVLTLVPTNNLGRQAAVAWGLPHIHDYKTDRDGQNALWADVFHRGGLVMCAESLHRIPGHFWERPVLLILDESNQIIDSLTQGDTLGSRYSMILEAMAAAARHAVQNGAIVLSEAGIPDRAVKFMETISGSKTVRVFTHKRESEPWKVTAYKGVIKSVSGFHADAVAHAALKKVLYVSSSQFGCEILERAIRKQYPDRKVVRIDSKTNERGEFTDFFENPDKWLQDDQPDVLILSPSAKSGVSIEGGVSVEDAYFDSVVGYFPSLGTDTAYQLLGRYRPAVPRIIYCPDFVQASGDESLLNPRAIRRRLGLNAKAMASVYSLGELLEETDDDEMAIRATIDSAVVDYWTVARAVAGNQKLMARVALTDQLKRSGHKITPFQMGLDRGTAALWKEIKAELWREEASAIAHAEVGTVDAPIKSVVHDLKWARKILDSLDVSLEIRILAQKVIWRSDFPGVLFDDPEECYEALTRDYGKMARGVKLQAKAENVEGARLEDAEATKAILSGNIKALHRLPKSHVQALLIAKSGVLELLDGEKYSNADSRCQAVKKFALGNSQNLYQWLRLSVNKDQTAIEICHKLLKKIGIERSKEDRKGAIEMVGRFGESGANSEHFKVDLDYCGVRVRLLEAARLKLRESITSTCNKERELLQIDVMPTKPAVTQPPEGEVYGLKIVSESDDSITCEYIPSPEEMAEWGIAA